MSARPAWRSAVLRCERCRGELAEVGLDVAGPDAGMVWQAARGRYEVEDWTKPGDGIRTEAKVYRSGLLLDDAENGRFIFKCGACGRSDIQVSHRRIREWLDTDVPPRVVFA